MASTQATLIPLNDGNITLTGLALNGVPTAGATVLATLLDESGAVVLALSNVALLDVGGSPGNYTAFIAGTFTAQPGNYILKITATKSGALYLTEQPVNVPFYTSVYSMPVGSLTTVPALKQALGSPFIQADRSMDDFLSRIIARFGAYALNLANRKAFLSQPYTERYNGNGGFMLCPRFAFNSSPITAISSLTVDGQVIPAAPDDFSSGYIFDDYTIYLRGCYAYTKGVQNITVTYTAGLTSIPKELEQAALDACAFWFRKREFMGKDSVTVQGETVVFDKSDIPATAMSVLKQYTRRK